MSKSIYIGNLPFNVTKQNLADFLANVVGLVSIQLVTDRETGQSRGFAFVEMDNDNNAQDAIDSLKGVDFNGRALTVNEARPRESRFGGGDNRKSPRDSSLR